MPTPAWLVPTACPNSELYSGFGEAGRTLCEHFQNLGLNLFESALLWESNENYGFFPLEKRYVKIF